MQIKNILLATLFVATTQVFCANEQTDVKAKLQAELEAKCESLSSLSKKITEKEATVQALTDKVHVSFIKYADWQDKKDTKDNLPTRDAAKAKEDLIQQITILQDNLSNHKNSSFKMRNISFDEEYKKDNETDHELLIYHLLMTSIETLELNKFIAKWKICFEEIADLEDQLDIA